MAKLDFDARTFEAGESQDKKIVFADYSKAAVVGPDIGNTQLEAVSPAVAIAEQNEPAEEPLYVIGVSTSKMLMKEKIKIKPERKTNSKYPFEILEIAQSFFVLAKDVEGSAIRMACTYAGKKLNKKFKCIKHKATEHSEARFEVARVA